MFASIFKAVFQHCSSKIFSPTKASKSNLRSFSQCQQQESNSKKNQLPFRRSFSWCPLTSPSFAPPDQPFAQLDLPLPASGSGQRWGSEARKPQRAIQSPLTSVERLLLIQGRLHQAQAEAELSSLPNFSLIVHNLALAGIMSSGDLLQCLPGEHWCHSWISLFIWCLRSTECHSFPFPSKSKAVTAAAKAGESV